VSTDEVFGLCFLAFACAEFYRLGFVESVRRAAWLERLARYLNGAGMMWLGMAFLLPRDARPALLFGGLAAGSMLASLIASLAHGRRQRIADSPR